MRDLNDLKLFTKLVEVGNLSAAAALLQMPKSTLSRRLSVLEAELGVRLFDRSTRHFTLTDVGMAYYARCLEIVASITAADQYASDLQQSPCGRLRISAPPAIATLYLGRIIAAFTSEHPEIAIELLVEDRVVNLLEEGYDLAIRFGSERGSNVATRLCSSTGYLCASQLYLDRKGTPATVGDLYEHALIMFMPSGMQAIKLQEQADGTIHEIAPSARLTSDNFAPVRDAIIAGAGIGWLPDLAMVNEIARGDLVRVLPNWKIAPVDLEIVYPARQTVPPRLRMFVDHLCRAFSPPPWEQAPPRRVVASTEVTAVEQVKGGGQRAGIPGSDINVENRRYRRAVPGNHVNDRDRS